jgi:hypothetical protein
MVAGRQDMSAQVEEIFRDSGRQPKATCGVLCIHYHEVNMAFLDNVREMLADDPPACTREDIPDKE